MSRSSTTETPAASASESAHVDPSDPRAPILERLHRLEDQYAQIAQLAGGLAHEIRNPLSTMRLTLDLLAGDFRGSESDRDRRALQKIDRLRDESLRLEGLLEDFLRYVRAGALPRSLTDLNAVVEDVRDFCEPQSLSQGIVTRVQLDPNLPRVAIHVDTFKQALLNLIRNAQHAMPDGGELILHSSVEGPMVRLDVIDTGVGIPPETQPRIFESFYSTRPKGTGLGLPTTRRIVEALGGSIEFESEPGKGTQFTVRLPRAAEADVNGFPPDAHAAPAPSHDSSPPSEFGSDTEAPGADTALDDSSETPSDGPSDPRLGRG